MPYVTRVVPNGGDTLFKIVGLGFGATQNGGFVICSDNNTPQLGDQHCVITSWSDTQIIGTLPSNHKMPTGNLFVVVYVNGHPTVSNEWYYTIS